MDPSAVKQREKIGRARSKSSKNSSGAAFPPPPFFPPPPYFPPPPGGALPPPPPGAARPPPPVTGGSDPFFDPEDELVAVPPPVEDSTEQYQNYQNYQPGGYGSQYGGNYNPTNYASATETRKVRRNLRQRRENTRGLMRKLLQRLD